MEIIGAGQAEEIGSLAATWIQSFLPTHLGIGDKLITELSFWTWEVRLAAFLCQVQEKEYNTSPKCYTDDNVSYVRFRTATYQVWDSSPSACLGHNLRRWSTRSVRASPGRGGSHDASCHWIWKESHRACRLSFHQRCGRLRRGEKKWGMCMFSQAEESCSID